MSRSLITSWKRLRGRAERAGAPSVETHGLTPVKAPGRVVPFSAPREPVGREQTAPAIPYDIISPRDIARSPLARLRRRRGRVTVGLFLALVVVPTAVVALYTGYFASQRYTSEFQFAVRGWDAPAMDAVGGVMGVPSGAAGVVLANSYIAVEFIHSRDAIEAVRPTIDPIKLFGSRDIDWWARYSGAPAIETFLPYWRSHVRAVFDPLTGIITGSVTAFDPASAQTLARQLEIATEGLINRLSVRAREDALNSARDEVRRAEVRLKEARLAVQRFRNTHGIVDPAKQIESAMLSLKLLRDERSKAQVELATQGALMAQNAPTLNSLRLRVRALEDQIRKAEDELASTEKTARVMSNVLADYQALEIDQNVAEKMYGNTLEALERARRDADRKHIYLGSFVQARLPEAASFPQPARAVGLTLLLALCIWSMALVSTHSLLDRSK